jgi:hypothetical protein
MIKYMLIIYIYTIIKTYENECHCIWILKVNQMMNIYSDYKQKTMDK